MGKLIKYEFIKNRMALLITLGGFLAAEAMILMGFEFDFGLPLAFGFLLEIALFPVCFFVGPIISAKTYTKELSDKSGYLVYMTPNSCYKIVGSKYLFAFIVELAYVLVVIGSTILNGKLLADAVGFSEEIYRAIVSLAQLVGIDLNTMLVSTLCSIFQFIMVILMLIGIYYVAHTLTATVMMNVKGRGLVAGVLFIIGTIGALKLMAVMPSAGKVTGLSWTYFLSLLPSFAATVGVIAVTYIITAVMLDKEVSL